MGLTCDTLEQDYGCVCDGCDCGSASVLECSSSSDCPSGMYCADIVVGSTEYIGCYPCTDEEDFACSDLGIAISNDCSERCSGCSVVSEDFLGDGMCESTGGYNTDACNWDGGDCCESTCVDGSYYCGAHGDFSCQDPTATDQQSCVSSCYGASCNYWVSEDYECSYLEQTFACDCTGCNQCEKNGASATDYQEQKTTGEIVAQDLGISVFTIIVLCAIVFAVFVVIKRRSNKTERRQNMYSNVENLAEMVSSTDLSTTSQQDSNYQPVNFESSYKNTVVTM